MIATPTITPVYLPEENINGIDQVIDRIKFDTAMNTGSLTHIETNADILAFVDCLVGEALVPDFFWVNSERLLYTALIALLRDWFPKSDYSMDGLVYLLELMLSKPSPLDCPVGNFIFHQIETGMRVVILDDLTWEYQPSLFKHNKSGIRPADAGGLHPDHEDAFALRNWNQVKAVVAGETRNSVALSSLVRINNKS